MDRPITVVEIVTFLRGAVKVWTDAERADFVDHIAANPEDGAIIPDTGGLRKIRWGREGSGKRGGVRVIYFYYNAGMPLYLISVYAKAEHENFTPDQKRTMTALVEQLKQQYRAKGGQS